nr:centromere protein M isoform X2 [Symphalangus syndactylus]
MAQSSGFVPTSLPHREAFTALAPLQGPVPHRCTVHPRSPAPAPTPTSPYTHAHPHLPPAPLLLCSSPPPTPSCLGAAGPCAGDGEGGPVPTSHGWLTGVLCEPPGSPKLETWGSALLPSLHGQTLHHRLPWATCPGRGPQCQREGPLQTSVHLANTSPSPSP